MLNNGTLGIILIQYIINGNYHKKNGDLDNNVYIQAILERYGMEDILLPLDPEACIGGFDPNIDYEKKLRQGAYRAITEKLGAKIFNRIAERI